MNEDDVDRMFKEGFDCSQIVLAEVSDMLGMTKDDAYKVASCFGLGIFQGNICGAAMGALMALGMRYGNHVPNDTATKLSLFVARDEFLRRFGEMNGHILCPELLGRDIRSMPEMIIASNEGVFLKCPGYCVNAVTILKDML